jgi:hypothetical protein
MYPFDNEDDDDQIIEDGQQTDIIDDDQQQQQDDVTQQQQQAIPQSFNPADIAQIVAATMQAHREPAAPRQMSAEEAAQHFQVFNPDESFVNGLNALADPDATPADRRKIIDTLRDGLVNQSFRAAELLMEQKMAELDQRYAPALQIAQREEAKQLQNAFVKKYPALKGQDQLVNSITAGLAQQGFKPKSADEAFDKVAQFAEQILQKVNPEFNLGTQKSGGGGRSPSMAGTNMGGHSGGFQTVRGDNTPQKRGGLASFYKK